MKNIHKLKPGNFYLFESLSSSNSIFFDTEQEIAIFKKLLINNLKKFVEIHKIFVDVNGYQILVRVKQRRTLKKNYVKECESKNKPIKTILVKEPWRIISEKMRIFKSIFVRTINKLRGREGVLVKHSYKKYYFDSKEEYESYIKKMVSNGSIVSQSNESFAKKRIHSKITNWSKFRAQKWAVKVVNVGLTRLVALNLINSTLLNHNPSHNPHPNLQTILVNIKSRRMYC